MFESPLKRDYWLWVTTITVSLSPQILDFVSKSIRRRIDVKRRRVSTGLWNQKLCGAILLFYIKMMKRRTLEACSLNRSNKKGITTVLGKMNLFRSGRGSFSPPSLLGYVLVYLLKTSGFQTFSGGIEMEH